MDPECSLHCQAKEFGVYPPGGENYHLGKRMQSIQLIRLQAFNSQEEVERGRQIKEKKPKMASAPSLSPNPPTHGPRHRSHFPASPTGRCNHRTAFPPMNSHMRCHGPPWCPGPQTPTCHPPGASHSWFHSDLVLKATEPGGGKSLGGHELETNVHCV